MLRIEVYVNQNKIDEIQLLNTGKIKNGLHLYNFIKPENLNNKKIYHKRSEGWSLLIEKALKHYHKICKTKLQKHEEEMQNSDYLNSVCKITDGKN